MYPLSDFSSVFEVATALCLAYGFIRSAYNFPLIAIEKQLNNAKEVLNDFGHDHPHSGLGAIIGLVERSYSIKKLDLDKLYILLAKLSILASLIPITFLITSGFYKGTFSAAAMVTIIIFAFIPTPVLSLVAWLKSKDLINKVKSQRELLHKEVMEVLVVSQSKATKNKQT
ncbi:hypothetical protein [Shewanella sp. MF08487]|uniref:hypothetical protein n=1 Tax=Shewanella sp. MF08487 TaxID=3434873 RepID=UPI003D7A9281